MPTYDYRCKHCGHEFEAFQSITDEPLKKCPDCGGNGLKRIIGAGAGIIFKGSGFYATDYKSGSSSSGSTGGSSSEGGSGDSSD
ncbi:MAG: zinc ribbon domain-containing protein [Candidatus Brocadiia bacterium]